MMRGGASLHRHRHHDDQDDADEQQIRRRLAPPSSDMNVTPLIDVLLVLLIIFMAALPLTQKGVDINLPLESNRPDKPPPPLTQVVVELTPSNQITVNGQTTSLEGLQELLRSMYETRTDKTVFVMGPPTARYGDVIAILDVVTGLRLRIAIVTEGLRAQSGR